MNAPQGATLLAFDTSTERLAVGLSCAGHRWIADEPGGAAASASLLPCAERLLGEAGLNWTDLDAIAFGRGPGAFTGLRTSCAVAQGLAVGLARPLLAIDSLLIVAEDARHQSSLEGGSFDIDVVMDARMGEVYAGRYRWDHGRWSALRAAELLSPQALSDHWRQAPPSALAGTALPALADGPWQGAVPPGRQWPSEASRAQALLTLAQAAWTDGATVDAAEALPTYLRNKVALTTAEREAARRAVP